MATTAALSAAVFCSGDSTLTMLVDSGATHNFVDPLLTPWLQVMMSDYCVLDVPHTIVTAGMFFKVSPRVLFKAPLSMRV